MKTLKAMKNIKDIKTFLLAGLVCFGMSAALTSCESELDEVPDNRTQYLPLFANSSATTMLTTTW